VDAFTTVMNNTQEVHQQVPRTKGMEGGCLPSEERGDRRGGSVVQPPLESNESIKETHFIFITIVEKTLQDG